MVSCRRGNYSKPKGSSHSPIRICGSSASDVVTFLLLALAKVSKPPPLLLSKIELKLILYLLMNHQHYIVKIHGRWVCLPFPVCEMQRLCHCWTWHRIADFKNECGLTLWRVVFLCLVVLFHLFSLGFFSLFIRFILDYTRDVNVMRTVYSSLQCTNSYRFPPFFFFVVKHRLVSGYSCV